MKYDELEIRSEFDDFLFDMRKQDGDNLVKRIQQLLAQTAAAARRDELERATGYMPAGNRSRTYVEKRLSALRLQKDDHEQ